MRAAARGLGKAKMPVGVAAGPGARRAIVAGESVLPPPRVALLLDRRAAAAGDGRRQTAAMLELGVGGGDDGVEGGGRQIALHQGEDSSSGKSVLDDCGHCDGGLEAAGGARAKDSRITP